MNRIKELRGEKKMKQEELAMLLAVQQQSVSRYEKGQNDLDTDTIARLCQIFDVSADYLLGLSSHRKLTVSAADMRVLAAYHAASDRDREIIDKLLGLDDGAAAEPSKEESAAS